MKTKEFKDIISQNAAKANGLILNIIEYSCIPFNSWFETHSRLIDNQLIFRMLPHILNIFCYLLSSH